MSNKKDFIIPFFFREGEELEKKVCPGSLSVTVTDSEEKTSCSVRGHVWFILPGHSPLWREVKVAT